MPLRDPAGEETGGRRPLVCTLGHLVLDVVVSLPHALALDDDTSGTIHVGAGGQAANVAAWAAHLGARSRYVGVRSDDVAGRLIAAELSAHGVEIVGSTAEGRAGVVVSVIADGTRTMASDPGAASVPDDALDEAWLAGCDWLFVSGYSLLLVSDPRASLRCGEIVRAAGGQVAVDLSASTLIETYGPERFRELLAQFAPDVVFANEREWQTIGGEQDPPAPMWVLKRGPAGCTFHLDAGVLELGAPTGTVVDPTGAGDALAAGFLVGGPELALAAAERCIGKLGAQP